MDRQPGPSARALGAAARPLGGATLEPLHATAGVDQLLLARVERVAVRADLHVHVALRRARLERVPARARHGGLDVLGMNIGLHDEIQCRCHYMFEISVPARLWCSCTPVPAWTAPCSSPAPSASPTRATASCSSTCPGAAARQPPTGRSRATPRRSRTSRTSWDCRTGRCWATR